MDFLSLSRIYNLQRKLHRGEFCNGLYILNINNKIFKKDTIFKDLTLCSPVEARRYFEVIKFLHLQGRRI
jgi:hypothetical protein